MVKNLHLSHSEACLITDRLLKGMKRMIVKEGYLFPTAYYINKSHDRDFELKEEKDKDKVYNPNIFEIENLYEGQEKPFVAVPSVFRSRDMLDDKFMMKYIATICKREQPDLFVFIQMGLYKETKFSDYLKELEKESISLDLDSISIIHVIYYLNGDEDAKLLFIPYINRGEVPSAGKDFDTNKSFDIMFTETGWVDNTKLRYAVKIKYPF